MNDLDLTSFRYGGVNITGFQVFDGTSPVAMETMRDWQKMLHQQQQLLGTTRHESTPDANDKISVRFCLYLCSLYSH